MTILDTLITRYPVLAPMKDQIQAAHDLLAASFASGGKLMLCGNGGSACDCEHIAGELMKSFVLPRPLGQQDAEALKAAGDAGDRLASALQQGLPCSVLHGLPGLSSAFANEEEPALVYAQQAWGYAREGDVLLGVT